MQDKQIVKLKNVRLSFPHLFTAHAMMEGQEPKFSATFLLDEETHGDAIEEIEELIEELAHEHWKGKKVAFTSCLRDGTEKPDMDGYGEGVMFISASRKSRPAVVDRKVNPVAEEDGIIYPGCYVNATIRLWVQDNKWGKRVNAELRAVQFVKEGEPFGAGVVNVEDEFESLDDEPTTGRRSRRAVAASVEDF